MNATKRQVRIKEKYVCAFITATFPNYEIRLNMWCPNAQNITPDILIDMKTHFIIVEIDENQHVCYDEKCEKSRMLNIAVCLKLPVVFIRFNPDAYVDRYGQKVKSCFKFHDKRPFVDCDDFVDWISRLRSLEDAIKRYVETPSQTITIEKLFYDTPQEERISGMCPPKTHHKKKSKSKKPPKLNINDEGRKFLACILTDQDKHNLAMEGKTTVLRKDLNSGVKQYTKHFDNNMFLSLKRTFNLDGRCYKSVEDLREKPYIYVKHVFKKVFNERLRLETQYKTTNPNRTGYWDDDKIIITATDNSLIQSL